MIEVRLPDGRVLTFPDGTPEAVVRQVAQRMMAGGPPASSGDAAGEEASGPPGIDPEREALRRRIADIKAHGDVGRQVIEDPGFLGMAGSTLKDSVLGPFVGLSQRLTGAERAPELPDMPPGVLSAGDVSGFGGRQVMPEVRPRDVMRREFERTREDYLASDPGAGRAAAALGTEFGANLIPLSPGAPAGAAASRAVGKLAPSLGAPATRLLAGAAAGAAEGGLVGFGDSAGLPVQEQLRQIALSAGAGGLLGGLGGARALAGMEDAGAFTPKPAPPEQAPSRPRLDGSDEIRQSYEAEKAEMAAKVEALQAQAMVPEEIVREAMDSIDLKYHDIFAQAGRMGDEALGRLADQADGALAPKVVAPPRDPNAGFEDLPMNPAALSPTRQRFDAWATQRGITPEELSHPVRRQQLEDEFLGVDSPDPALADFGVEARNFQLEDPDPGAWEVNLFGKTWTIPGRRRANPEAGFLSIGKKPPVPADPFDAVVRNGPDPKPQRTAMDRLRSVLDRVQDEFSNQEAALPRRMARAGLKKEALFVEQLQDRARGAGVIADTALVDGTYLWDPVQRTSVRTGDSLRAVVGGMDEAALRDLGDLLAVQHHYELINRQAAGERLSIDARGTALADAKMADLQQRYGQDPATGRVNQLADLGDKIRDWSIRAVLMPLKDAGRLSDDEFTFQQGPNGYQYSGRILDKNGFYAPFFRLIDELADDTQILVGSTKKNPLERISGGLSPDKPIAPPLESFVVQAQKIAVWAERQRVRNTFADYVDASPELQQVISRSTAGPRDRPAAGAFTVWRDGKRYEYKAPADVMLALERVTPKQATLLGNLARAAARTVRVGTTYTLEFGSRNFVRDQFSAAAYGSKYGYRPFYDAFAGLAAQVPGTRLHQHFLAWKREGGALASLPAQDRGHVQRTLADVTKPSVGRSIANRWKAETNPFIKYGLFPALAPLEAFSEVLERSTRVGAYRRAVLKGASGLEAASFSRNSTLDFGRSGSFGQKWNSVEAFANANLQDVARFTREARRSPVRMSVLAGTYLVIPAVVNYAKWREDEDYQNLPEWEKQAFLHVGKREDGTFWRVPRPLGMLNLAFSYGVQKFLEATDAKDPDAVSELLDSVVDQTPLNYASLEGLPSIAQPAVEAGFGPGGYSSFRDAPIVPQSLQGALPEDRYLDSTTLLARKLGAATGTAPLKVDYLIRGYGATVGATLAQGASAAMGDEGLPELPGTMRDVPGVRGFVSTPSIGFASDPVTKLYALEKEASEAARSMDLALERGDALAYQRIVREHPEALMADALADVKGQVSEMRKLRNQVRSAPGMEPEDRADALLSIDQAATALSGSYMHGIADYLRGRRP